GKPSLHKAFDEATAILAGDALLTDAFAIAASAPVNAALQARELAIAAGSAGMVGGQFDDVNATVTASGHSEASLRSVHARKTGCLFVASCAMGALAAGADAGVVERAREYARHFGLAFQIADDVLDVTSGRGRDAVNETQTFATVLGVDAAKVRARAEAEAARAVAQALGSPVLEDLARFSAARDR
ncbi:MAG TPA: polyprenyl synthetase family protein, partial [Myxococcota bacterium]